MQEQVQKKKSKLPMQREEWALEKKPLESTEQAPKTLSLRTTI